jgi:hypothetical protein
MGSSRTMAALGVIIIALASSGILAAKPDEIVVRPEGDGSGVTITAPSGLGEWYLHFPETMLLEGPPQGKAKLTKTVAEDGTIMLAGRMEGEFAHDIRITYKPGKDSVDLTLEVTNRSKRAWRYGGEAMACLRPLKSPDLMEQTGERTLVLCQGKPQSVAAIGKRLGMAIGPQTTVSCPVRGEDMAPYQLERHDKRWTVDAGVIGRPTTDNKRVVAFAWDRAHRVSMNFIYACMHANPRILPLAPGESCRRSGRIYFMTGGVEDFWKRYGKDFRG